MWLVRRGCAEERRRLGWRERGVNVEHRTGGIVLRGLVEGGSGLRFETWRRGVMICEVEQAVVAR